ncbi:MAG: RNA 2',3'-cyclic phosphodiesterase [Parvularculaceae bacterium]|nr:RNA 2',3'-cyclic phosphodiesterase [Parvularculaceae bacterium]
MHRLFVAIALPAPVVEALVDLQTGVRGARWLPEENFHLTLAFIGETDRHGLQEAASALGGIAAPAFDLKLSACGYFGDRKPRALWAGAAPAPALSHLQSKVDIALRRCGFLDDKRKFTPHVTLAYLHGVPKDEAELFCADHALFAAGPFRVDAFHLFESHLGTEAAHYEIVASYSLSSR